MKSLLLSLAAVCVSLPAFAQTEVRRTQVYRCGPEGRELRDSPCPNDKGSGSAVDYDQPSAADSKAARQRHIAESKQAVALASARRASEAEARRMNGQATVISTLPPPARTASGPQVVQIKPPKTTKPTKPATSPGTGR